MPVPFVVLLGLLVAFAVLNGCSADRGESEEWLEYANLEAQESKEELYAAALREETMVIYTDSTRILDTKAAFEQAYPGLNVEVQIIRGADAIVELEKYAGQGERMCDVLVCPDIDAILSTRFVPEGLLYKYVPEDIADSIAPEYNGTLLGFFVEGSQIFYNVEICGSSPISNWWELTEPQYRGRVYMTDPLRSRTTAMLMCAMIQRDGEMSEAYSALYGAELDVPEGSSAGWEFWQRLLENDVQFTSSSDEAMEFVAMLGQDDTPIGVLVSSKMRTTAIGYPIAVAYDVAPATGVLQTDTISIVAGSRCVNTAKLFIRFLLGETDGTGEGYKPFLQEGAWAVRMDVQSESQIPLEQAGFWQTDWAYYEENIGEIKKTWSAMREAYIEAGS